MTGFKIDPQSIIAEEAVEEEKPSIAQKKMPVVKGKITDSMF